MLCMQKKIESKNKQGIFFGFSYYCSKTTWVKKHSLAGFH